MPAAGVPARRVGAESAGRDPRQLRRCGVVQVPTVLDWQKTHTRAEVKVFAPRLAANEAHDQLRQRRVQTKGAAEI
jgi:hypothetical protein